MTAPACPASADPFPDPARAAAADATDLSVSSRTAAAAAMGRSDPARAAMGRSDSAPAAADPMGLLAPPAHRLPRRRTSSPRPWEPLSDDEWAVLAPFVLRSAGAAGRPVRDPRARLDAIFRLAADSDAAPGRALAPWRALPAEHGKPDTASRQCRRWAAQGLWSRLLRALADPDYPGICTLRRLESWICRTYRRAWRILGVPGVALARRLGFLSAMRAPSVFLPDPDLSEYVRGRLQPLKDRLDRAGPGPVRMPDPGFLRACAWLLRAAGGRRRIPRLMAPR